MLCHQPIILWNVIKLICLLNICLSVCLSVCLSHSLALCLYVWIVYICVCVCTWIYACTLTSVWVQVRVRVYKHVYVYVCVWRSEVYVACLPWCLLLLSPACWDYRWSPCLPGFYVDLGFRTPVFTFSVAWILYTKTPLVHDHVKSLHCCLLE